jgi:hypothetical protein
MQLGIDGVGEVETFDQQQAGSQAAKASAANLGRVVVVDVAVLQEAAPLLLPLPLAQPTLDAPLAVTQPLPDAPLALGLPFPYLGLHLKYLAQQGKTGDSLTSLFSGTAEVFQAYGSNPCPKTPGDSLVLGLA